MKPTVRDVLAQNPNGLNIEEIRVKTGLTHRQVKKDLDSLPIHFDGEFYKLVTSPEHRDQLEHGKIATPAQPVDKTIVKEKRKPFTPNPTKGYEVKGNKVRIFLDRKNNAKSITLTADDLKELVNAVEKAG